MEKAMKIWVFVDVDLTLVDKEDNPRPHFPQFIKRLHDLGCVIVIWSAGGDSYAESKFHMINNWYHYRAGMPGAAHLRKYIHTFLGKRNWTDTGLILREPQFYIDDEMFLIDAMEEKGHGVFKIPAYEASVDPSHQDRWLLYAADAVERFVNDRHEEDSRQHNPDNGDQPSQLQDVEESSDG
jgi:hydroxymethylpyrimidine pyrophosphatase-like HAD family hydrolase